MPEPGPTPEERIVAAYENCCDDEQDRPFDFHMAAEIRAAEQAARRKALEEAAEKWAKDHAGLYGWHNHEIADWLRARAEEEA